MHYGLLAAGRLAETLVQTRLSRPHTLTEGSRARLNSLSMIIAHHR